MTKQKETQTDTDEKIQGTPAGTKTPQGEEQRLENRSQNHEPRRVHGHKPNAVYEPEEVISKPVDDKGDKPVDDKVEQPVDDKVEQPVDDKVEQPVDDKVEQPTKKKKKKKKIRYAFPTVSRCPRCRTTDTVAYRTVKNIQYRRCLRAICRWSYSVRGEKV